MLTIAGYAIDRIVRVTEHEFGATLELLSGKVCLIPKRDRKTEGLIGWAKDMLAFHAAMALRITNDEVVDAAEHTYRPVGSIRPKDDNTIQVWLLGRPGPYRFSLTNGGSQQALLVRSASTKCKLLFLIRGTQIDAVVELSPSELENLTTMDGIL